jgi:hypothetical protein
MAKNLCQEINGKTGSTFKNAFVKGNGATDGFMAFQQASGTLADLSSDVGALAFEGTTFKRWNGTSWGTVSGSGGVSTFEDLFASDQTFALSTTTAWTISQSAAGGILVLTKTNTGAGAIITTNNAGTGIDLAINKTESSSTGVVFNTFHNSTTAADADVIFEHLVRGVDDAGTPASVSYGRVRFLADDVSAASEDATYQLALMVAGTSRTCLDITGGNFQIGDGNANATLQSSGNFDLILQTGNATTGTMTIADGANGNIQIAPDGTGILDLNSGFDIDAGSAETCTLTVTGTTGNGLAIDSSTITSGNVVTIDHTVSGTLSGGKLLNLLVDSSTVWSVGETGNTTIGGVDGSNVLTISAGDAVITDGSFTITNDADNAATLSVTNNTATTASPFVFAGSGAFTGSTTTSFMTLTPSGLTTGTALYILTAAATTLAKAVDISTSTTTGKGVVITMTGINTGVGKALEIIADTASTAGASVGEGVVTISADALTTGAAFNVESLSNEVMTSGQLADFAHSAVGTTVAAKTGALIRLTSSITESGTSTQDFDMMSIVRTSIHDTAGTLTATGSLLYLENVATETGATLTDTVNGLEVVMDAQGTGTGVKVTHPATTGKSLDVIASTTTGTVALLTMDSLTTTGVGLSLTNTGTGVTSGSVLRVASGTTSAVATNGVVSLFATGAFTSTAVTDGFVRVNGNSTLTGTIVAVNGNALTSGIAINIGDTGTGMTSGSLIRATSASTGAVATNGILSVQATGAYTSTANMGILAAIANTTTAGTVAYISATSMIGGTLLFLNATAATLTGKYIQCYDGAADDFSVGQYGATIIAGNASGTAALTLTNGNILLSSGNVTLTAGTIIETAQAILNANTAISVTHGVTKIANNGASTHTLADGVEGQKKTIVCTVYTADAVITPANLANGTTITLNAVNDAVDLVFLGTEWWVTNLYLTAAVA